MWPNPQFHADLVTFTEEILNGKPIFLCGEISYGLFPAGSVIYRVNNHKARNFW